MISNPATKRLLPDRGLYDVIDDHLVGEPFPVTTVNALRQGRMVILALDAAQLFSS